MSSLALPFPIPVSWFNMNSLLIFYPRAPYRSHRLQNADQRQKVNSGPWQWKFWSSSASSPLWRPCPDSLFARKKGPVLPALNKTLCRMWGETSGLHIMTTAELLTTAAYFAHCNVHPLAGLTFYSTFYSTKQIRFSFSLKTFKLNLKVIIKKKREKKGTNLVRPRIWFVCISICLCARMRVRPGMHLPCTRVLFIFRQLCWKTFWAAGQMAPCQNPVCRGALSLPPSSAFNTHSHLHKHQHTHANVYNPAIPSAIVPCRP